MPREKKDSPASAVKKRGASVTSGRKRASVPAAVRTLRQHASLRGSSVAVPAVRYAAAHGKIFVSLQNNARTWRTFERPVLEPRAAYFDDTALSVIEPPLELPDGGGTLLVYCITEPLALGAALFDPKDPTKLVRRSESAFWSTDDAVQPVRVERLKDHLVIILKTASGDETKTVVPLARIFETQRPVVSAAVRRPRLTRSEKNPIITPRGHLDWEAVATFNPAAIHLNGKVHILYRAVGTDGISTVGYAVSPDGMTIEDRLPHPIYIPVSPFDRPVADPGVERFPSFSGGGFGGCEDPRAVEIDGRIYMTYTAFDGRHPPGVAIPSVATEAFLAHPLD